MIFLPHLSCRGVWRYTLITHHMGLTQIAQMPQIIFIIQLICVSQSPRGGRWAYCHTPLRHRMGLTQIDLINQIYYFLLRFLRFLRDTPHHSSDSADNLYNPINLCGPIIHMRRAYCNNALITHDMGLTQIDLIKQIYYFPRFLRETPLPLADCADAAERYMGLTQIDLIIQIYYFLCGFCDFCEILLFLSQMALMPQKGIWVSLRLI